MSKKTVTFLALVGLTVGSLVPMALGWDPTGLNGLSILGGLIGGILAIWLAVVLSKNLNL